MKEKHKMTEKCSKREWRKSAWRKRGCMLGGSDGSWLDYTHMHTDTQTLHLKLYS